MCVCLVLFLFLPHSRRFHTFGVVYSTGEGLQISTYTWHSLSLSNEGSFTCSIYCDNSIRLWRSSPRIRETHIFCRAFGSRPVLTIWVCPDRESNSDLLNAKSLAYLLWPETYVFKIIFEHKTMMLAHIWFFFLFDYQTLF